MEQAQNMITRRVTVARNRSAQEAISATGCKQEVDPVVLAHMSHGDSDEVDLYFFSLNDKEMSCEKLMEEYSLRGLKPADPFAVAAANEADPSLADEYANSTVWRDSKGQWYFVGFLVCEGDRVIGAFQLSYSKVGGDAFYAGVHK